MPPTHLLKTPRLALREVERKDAPLILELMNEPAYLEHIGDRGVRTIDDAVNYIEDKYTASYVRNGYGLYLVELMESTTPLGVCGLVRREVIEHPDLGFAYLRRFWGKGYAAEAAAAMLGYARDNLSLPIVYGLVSPNNIRSIRVLERLGMQFTRVLQLPGQASTSHLYAIEFSSI